MNPAIRAFLRAAADGDTGRVRALLVQGTDVNSTNAAGQTALILATAFQHDEVVELLLKARADIEHQDELGLTALDWARPSPRILELLKSPPKPVVQPKPEVKIPTSTALVEPKPEPGVTPAPLQSSPEVSLETPSIPVQNTNVQSTPSPTREEPALRGLAAAILRDHKPKQHVEPVLEPATSEEVLTVAPEITSDVTSSEPIPSNESIPPLVAEIAEPVETKDETLGGRVEASDDTLPRNLRPPSRSRIFDLNAPDDPVPPRSKVQVNVPQTTNGSRNGVLIWLLVVLVLAGGSYAGYRVVSWFSKSQTQTESTVTPRATPEVVEPAAANKRAPVVSGDFAGAELYLADAEYPAEATVKEGKVTVEIRVSRKGIVVQARAVDGDESLQAAAEKAARSSAFSPEKLEDRPSLMSGTITYYFNSSFKATADNNASSNGKVTVTSGGPLAGAELKLVQPVAPSNLKNEVENKVTIVVRVDRTGRVVSWRALEGAQQLRTVAVRAAKLSTFSPDKLPNTGDVVGTITYNFH